MVAFQAGSYFEHSGFQCVIQTGRFSNTESTLNPDFAIGQADKMQGAGGDRVLRTYRNAADWLFSPITNGSRI